MAEKQWISKIKQELNELPDDAAESERWRKQSIYKIPASITDLNERAYKPQIVSIGPYHHGVQHLKAMEKHKRRALFHFLKRSNQCLETLVEVLTPVVEDAKDAYDQLDSEWHQNNDKFLEMMILDGCFILEILRTTYKRMSPNEVADDYPSNDPLFSYRAELYVFRNLRYDMLMLENQIPMLVLEKLASVQNDVRLQKDYGMSKLILNFFSPGKATLHPDRFQGCLHVLDVHRRSLVLEEPQDRSHDWEIGQREHVGYRNLIRSVTELKGAGIMIKLSESRSIKNITFRDGFLRLPLVVVDDVLEPVFLNLIAFERFHVGAGNEVTSYVCFMNNIIADAKDVSLLHSCGIIENVLGRDMDVANLFTSLSREATFDPNSSLAKVHLEVSAYCRGPFRQWKANLVRNYITTPYATVSITEATTVLLLTMVQTFYSVMSYARQYPNT